MKIEHDYLTMLKNTDEEGFSRVKDFFSHNENIKKPAISGQDNELNKTMNTNSIQQKEAE
ncbi:hypothetical protein M2S00_06875 [Apilactobacillus sp. TMW 2.2459]|uniref:hypothetical protein n=1 Tax=Apilactobacillus xinyiensis TaxID=2841032 RepID=UPI00200EE0CD|nr:hypothetical protein [Apilactobacillus xinyiensis]MCL0312828.1 hypothetical protein [Apilactobacillus xinyiensis]